MDPLADSVLRPLWLDNAARPAPRPPLDGPRRHRPARRGRRVHGTVDGAAGRSSGNPDRRVLLVEADRIAEHATGRNGGFCEAQPDPRRGATAGSRWPDEYDDCTSSGCGTSTRSSRPSARYGIDCGFGARWHAHRGDARARGRRPGAGGARLPRRGRRPRSWWTRRRTWPAGSTRARRAMVDPARLAWGLADAVEALGVRIAEGTRARVRDQARGDGVAVRPPTRGSGARRRGGARDQRLPPLLRRLRLHDGAGLRLRPGDRAADRATARGAAAGTRASASRDSGNQFHYYRLTAGPPDPLGRVRRGLPLRTLDRRGARRPPRDLPDAGRALRRDLPAAATGIRFTHRWSGVIDTCTRFCAFFGTAHRGRTAYAAGFTGLGVGASRFAADVMLDLLAGEPDRADPAGDGPRASRCRSRPSPWPGRASSSPPARSRVTTGPAGATCGCARWTGSDWGSTRERPAHSRVRGRHRRRRHRAQRGVPPGRRRRPGRRAASSGTSSGPARPARPRAGCGRSSPTRSTSSSGCAACGPSRRFARGVRAGDRPAPGRLPVPARPTRSTSRRSSERRAAERARRPEPDDRRRPRRSGSRRSIDTDGLLAAACSPTDGHCTPESVVLGYAGGRPAGRRPAACAARAVDRHRASTAGRSRAVRTDARHDPHRHRRLRGRRLVGARSARWPASTCRSRRCAGRSWSTEPMPGLDPRDAVHHRLRDAASTSTREGPGLLLGMSDPDETPGFKLGAPTPGCRGSARRSSAGRRRSPTSASPAAGPGSTR